MTSIAAFWCRVSPNCHQNLRVLRPRSAWNRDLDPARKILCRPISFGHRLSLQYRRPLGKMSAPVPSRLDSRTACSASEVATKKSLPEAMVQYNLVFRISRRPLENSWPMGKHRQPAEYRYRKQHRVARQHLLRTYGQRETWMVFSHAMHIAF